MRPTVTSPLARTLHGFFTDYLPCQRAMSPHTLHSYRDSLKLFLRFVAGKRRDPTTIVVEDLTAERTLDFLRYLESHRNNKASTRNIRLSAVHSFFRYLGGEHPEHLELAQRILSIPFKRTELRQVEHFEFTEIQAVLDAVNRSTRDGRRDFALLSLMFNTGARVSEIVTIKATDLRLIPPPSVLLKGKGSKQRAYSSDSRATFLSVALFFFTVVAFLSVERSKKSCRSYSISSVMTEKYPCTNWC